MSERISMITCNYCGADAVLVDSAEVYRGKSYGPIWLCRPCRAWVGCHRGSNVPLGRLADARLRYWKKRAHESFDRLWKGEEGTMARDEAYREVARRLGLSADECHIGMMDVDGCKAFEKVSNEIVREI